MGAEGARAYLKKYGKGIGQEKLNALGEYARDNGYTDFADEVEKQYRAKFSNIFTPAVPSVSAKKPEDLITEFSYARASGIFNTEILSDYTELMTLWDNLTKEERESLPNAPKLIECPVWHLRDLKAGTMVGKLPNQAWVEIAEILPNLLVRTVIFQKPPMQIIKMVIPSFLMTGTCDIRIKNNLEIDKIEELAAQAGGCLKACKHPSAGSIQWRHFNFS